MKNRFKKSKTRADTKNMLALFLNSEDEFPIGYRPLSKCEEIIQCANVIADMTSSMTIMLMQNGKNGDIRIKNGLSKLLDINPCQYMDRKNFIFKIVKDMILSGNSVVWPEVNEKGYIESLEPLEARQCGFRAAGKSYLIQYKEKIYQPDEVLHFVLIPDEREPFKGVGYKSALINTVSNLAQANETKKGFLKSKWKPSMVISVQSDVEEFESTEVRKKILGSYTDTVEAGEPWLIPAGEMDIKTIQPLTLEDLAIHDSIILDKKTIAAAIGVPGYLVGIGEFNKDEHNNFVSTKIMAFAQIIQQQLSRKAIYSAEQYIKFNRKSLMQYDLGEHADFIKAMVGGGMLNRNEGRNEFDYSPVDNEGMDDYIVLENYIPVSKVGEQKKLKEKEQKNE